MPSQSRLDGEGTSVHEMTRLSPEVLIVVGDGSSLIAPTKPCIRVTMAKMGGRHTCTILMLPLMPAMCTNNIMSHHKMEKLIQPFAHQMQNRRRMFRAYCFFLADPKVWFTLPLCPVLKPC